MAAGRRVIHISNLSKLSPTSFRCRLQDQNVDALYSPAVGANLMSDEFALAFLCITISLRQTDSLRDLQVLLRAATG